MLARTRIARFLPLAALVACGGPNPPAETPPQATAATATPAVTAAPTAAPTSAAPANKSPIAYPETPKRPVVNEYHGTRVEDPYQWLENENDPEVKRWAEAETKVARAWLDALPGQKPLREKITKLKTGQTADYFYLQNRGGTQFALKFDPPKQQPILVTLPSLDDPKKAKVVVDPNALDAKGGIAIDFYIPSLDGKKVAVSLSKGGSEKGDVHVYDVASGKELPDVIPYVNGGTAGGSLTWAKDGKGFFYTRYPRGNERPPEDQGFFQQVYFHKLGEPTEKDVYSIGKDFPRIAEVELATSDDGKWVLAQVANGDGGEFAHYLYDGKKWTQFTTYADAVKQARFGRDGKVYMLSQNGAPRGKILRVAPDKPAIATAETLVPESDATIESMQPMKSSLYVVDLLGGPSRVRVFDLKGKAQGEIPLPNVASVGQVARLDKGDDVLLRVQTFVDPPAWYRFTGKGKATKSGLYTTSPADLSDAEVIRETCASKDGTKVPINIVRRKGTVLNKENPALLTGYGGYEVSIKPRFNEDLRVWLDAGGVLAVANLRGGGEFGEAWHKAGRLTKKQNVFDDFAACAKHLVDTGYTKPEKLSILGGSNGGLLMGAMITQHPEMFRAVVSRVGIYDMLRVELSPNGAFNVTEFGTVKDPELFKALYAYSPFHHVTDGTTYPSVLFTTGLNDPRVLPWQSYKMTARLQASGSPRPVLLVARSDAGHGVGGSLEQEIDETTDMFAFLFNELGIPVEKAAAAPPAKAATSAK